MREFQTWPCIEQETDKTCDTTGFRCSTTVQKLYTTVPKTFRHQMFISRATELKEPFQQVPVSEIFVATTQDTRGAVIIPECPTGT